MNLEKNQYEEHTIEQYNNKETKMKEDILLCEESYTISYTCKYNDKEIQGEKTLFASPIAIDKLALGHVVLDCLPCYDADFSFDIKNDDHHCTLALEAKDKAIQKESQKHSINCEELLVLMEEMLNTKGKWNGAGCFHCATLYHPITKEKIVVEDIGRHNCIDRLKGHCLQNNTAIEEYFLFITARITASIYAKIRRAGISTIISKSAITGTPFERANKEDVCLVAFCRKEENSGRFTIYSKGKNEFVK